MKKMKCDQCNVELEGENFDEWFKACHAHYQADHADIMKKMMETGIKEEGEKWREDAKKRFDEL